MATQLKTTSFCEFPIQTTPPRNIRVAFIAGEAVQAVAKKLAADDGIERDVRVDQITLRSFSQGLVATAKQHLSPDVYTAYVRWLEVAARHSTRWTCDEDGLGRADGHSEAVRAMFGTPCANVHDLAVRAYALALTAGDHPSFGPIQTFRDEPYDVDVLSRDILPDVVRMSPVVAEHQGLAQLAWTFSGKGAVGITPALGETITAVFSYARNLDAVEREAHVPATALSAEYDRFARGPLTAWQRAYDAFRSADRKMREFGNGPLDEAHDRLLAAQRRAVECKLDPVTACAAEDKAADEAQAAYEKLVTDQEDAFRALMRTPAPGPGEFAFKMEIGAAEEIFADNFADRVGGQLLLDAQRLARQPRRLPMGTLANYEQWIRAYWRYMQLREAGDAIEDGDPRQDAAVSAWCDAMDHVVMATPAPNIATVITKLELSLERWAEFPFPEEFSAPILADLRRLSDAVSAPCDPLVEMLAERNDLIARLNDEVDPPSEAEMEEGCARLNEHDTRILGNPAVSTDGLISKLLVAVQLAAEGHEVEQSMARDLVAEAQRLTGQGTLAGASA